MAFPYCHPSDSASLVQAPSGRELMGTKLRTSITVPCLGYVGNSGFGQGRSWIWELKIPIQRLDASVSFSCGLYNYLWHWAYQLSLLSSPILDSELCVFESLTEYIKGFEIFVTVQLCLIPRKHRDKKMQTWKEVERGMTQWRGRSDWISSCLNGQWCVLTV